ncbi:cryptochrome/photolyase family protein [Fulvivirga sedimenti]|uniref:Cryptochrome/photolyase family protein n=1 Tax=Fulvivirga sedimenti TaxID=2879465 RepID=A0A9X1HU86_9BACT|nr:cryptochrome/photolyase family protein [Fulvivirga sedimenti]MCA6078403.1 cryptochrome/photolyase family protein [Fulvivirga sedimenti]
MEITIVFPHQLFTDSPAVGNGRPVYIYEDPLFFQQYPFHKKKLILHRASMKYFAEMLAQRGVDSRYCEIGEYGTLKKLFEYFTAENVSSIHYVYTDDYLLERRLARLARQSGIGLQSYESPLFLLDREGMNDQLGEQESYFMASFYKKQRRRFGLLMENGQPEGGKWSFDDENRKKLPSSVEIPGKYIPRTNDYLTEAITYVERNFPDNPGIVENFVYPVTHLQAKEWLANFLEHRIDSFGAYEDAISDKDPFLFHSVLTPSLNIGLLTPQQILTGLMDRHERKSIPLNSLEGFIRQIIGWREFMRAIYFYKGTFQRKSNVFGHQRKIPRSFWTGETGIVPVDDTIKKVLEHAYGHHIERLMILGNFMLLCEFDPDEVYRWFMALFIDAYDWVMVPNVYGMTQYSDNGVITTKPYISGSNYIRKMSHYKTGEWSRIWDALYWRFIHVHQEDFSGNPRMNMILSLLNRMDPEKLRDHLERADTFLNGLKD